MAKKELVNLIVSFFKKKKINKIFCVPGGSIFHLYDAFSKDNFFQIVSFYNEQSCVIAAESYYKLTDKIALVLVTSGPGMSNTSTGVLNAFIDSVPIFIICGNAQSKYLKYNYLRNYAPQGVSAIKVLGQISKKVVEFKKNDSFDIIPNLYELSKKIPSGPVVLQIPLDLQKRLVSFKNNKNFNALKQNTTKNFPNIEKLLKSSYRPVILLGGGCTSPLTRSLVHSLSKKNIPITVSWTAKDIINHDNKNFCGLPGYFCNRSANLALYFSDLIISIGSRLDLLQTGYNFNEMKNKKQKIIYVNLDINELRKFKRNKRYKLINTSSEDFIKYLNNFNFENLDKSWSNLLNSYYLKYLNELVEHRKKSNFNINPYRLLKQVSKLDKVDIFVSGSSGGSAEISFLNYFLTKGTRFLNSPGLGAMGFAIPSILGALESKKNGRIITIVGDGGFQWNIQELANISNYKKRKVLIIVLNNGGYDSMRRSLKRYFGRAKKVGEESGLFFPNLKKISNAYNFNYHYLRSEIKLEQNIKKIWTKINKPTILEINTKKNVDSFPKVKPYMNEKGEIISGKLIDLDPQINDKYYDLL